MAATASSEKLPTIWQHDVEFGGGRVLGSGANGQVVSGSYCDKDGVKVEVAIKRIFLLHETLNDLGDIQGSQRAYLTSSIRKECELLKKLSLQKSGAILRVYGALCGTSEDDICGVVMEMLQPFWHVFPLRRNERHLYYAEALAVANDIVGGLAALAHAGVVHRDLKPENLLVNRLMSVKLADLGCAREYGENAVTPGQLAEQTGTIGQGTPLYQAPEARGAHHVGSPMDVFSFGVTMIELCTGRTPSPTAEITQVERQRCRVSELQRRAHELALLRAVLPQSCVHRNVPDKFCSIVERCLNDDPAKRPTIRELVNEIHRLRNTEERRPDDGVVGHCSFFLKGGCYKTDEECLFHHDRAMRARYQARFRRLNRGEWQGLPTTHVSDNHIYDVTFKCMYCDEIVARSDQIVRFNKNRVWLNSPPLHVSPPNPFRLAPHPYKGVPSCSIFTECGHPIGYYCKGHRDTDSRTPCDYFVTAIRPDGYQLLTWSGKLPPVDEPLHPRCYFNSKNQKEVGENEPLFDYDGTFSESVLSDADSDDGRSRPTFVTVDGAARSRGRGRGRRGGRGRGGRGAVLNTGAAAVGARPLTTPRPGATATPHSAGATTPFPFAGGMFTGSSHADQLTTRGGGRGQSTRGNHNRGGSRGRTQGGRRGRGQHGRGRGRGA